VAVLEEPLELAGDVADQAAVGSHGWSCPRPVAIRHRRGAPSSARRAKFWRADDFKRPCAADAGKEGGFMGFGGEQVSGEEQRMLEQVRAALGIA
jgi:hypothetical protein